MNITYPGLPDGYYWWVGRQQNRPLEPHIKLMRKGRWSWLDNQVDYRKPVLLTILHPDETLEEIIQEAINSMYDNLMSEQKREEEWNSFKPPGRN